jgi:hypothetical protein
MSGRRHGYLAREAEAVRIRLLGDFRVSVGDNTVSENAWVSIMRVHPPVAREREAHATGTVLFAPGHVFQQVEVFLEGRLRAAPDVKRLNSI